MRGRWLSWRVDAAGTSERTLYYLLHLAAASGDWVAVDAIARDIEALGLVNAANLGPIAFFLSMQGRHAEAAAVYARIDPLPEDA